LPHQSIRLDFCFLLCTFSFFPHVRWVCCWREVMSINA
jgi:hypothetical protein